MLRPSAHVPHMLCGDVEGVDGTRAWVDLSADLLDRITLWAGGPRGMADAQFDLVTLQALIALLSEAEACMQPARRTQGHAGMARGGPPG